MVTGLESFRRWFAEYTDQYTIIGGTACALLMSEDGLDAGYLIPFKAKAWLDLTERKGQGEHVDSKNIRKHKNDVFRLSILLTPDTKVIPPSSIQRDLETFFSAMEKETVDLKSFGIRSQSLKEIIRKMKLIYGLI